jgi:uncharacterized iron-regulated membrane protein
MRRIFFWTHFTIGLCVGLFILIMAATGVLLTYERQVVSAVRNTAVHEAQGAKPLSLDALADAAVAAGAAPGTEVTIPRNRSDVVKVVRGKNDTILLDPYTGEVLPDNSKGVRAFFSRVEAIHRWFAFTGKRTKTGEFIKNTANLIFAFILLTGAVLWWPRKWKWPLVKMQLFFRRGLPNARARHYNWHHVLAAWAFIPLMAIVLTGIVFSYSWANRLVYAAYGETPPKRSKGPATEAITDAPLLLPVAVEPVPLDEMVGQVTDVFGNWRRLVITLPAADAAELNVAVDWGNGVQAGKKRTLKLARDGSGLIGEPMAKATTPGSKARGFIRFLHTGEVFGIIGQTIAGLAALAALVLIYTGLSLGIRRLIRMRKSAKA